MYSFSRRVIVNPAKARASVAAGIETAARIRTITGREFTVWSDVMSPQVGALTFSCMCEHLEELAELGDKLAVDDAFNEYVESNSGLILGTATDSLQQIVSGTPALDSVEYIQVTSAVAGPGTLAKAMSAGVELAEVVAKVTGRSTVFLTSVTGPYGGATWAVAAPDIAALEQGNEAIAADTKFQQLVDRVGPLFPQGAESSIVRRLA